MRNTKQASRLTTAAVILLALVSLARSSGYTRPTTEAATTAAIQA